MSTFKIMAERCDQCLFGENKVVSNKRRAEILKGLRARDNHFICHKASIAGVEIACRGDWDQNGCGQLGRIMGRLGVIEFVSEPSPSPSDAESAR